MKYPIPIFYACDDAFVKYTLVSAYSLIKNASKDYKYHIHILHTDITEETKKLVYALADDNFIMSFDDVTEYLSSIAAKLPIRDYYTKTT